MDKYYKIYLNHFLWTYIVSPFETTHNNLETIPSGDILIISTVPPQFVLVIMYSLLNGVRKQERIKIFIDLFSWTNTTGNTRDNS